MLAKLSNWLDDRTGYRKFVSAMLIEHIPGGAKWRYVWGSCLAFVFGVQLITGVLLMTSYSAGDSTAWSSVYFIQYEMDFGWLIRGLHHFGSQTMVVLLGLHMLQVVIAGAHLPPREINWWLGLLLAGAILGLSLTGYLLPWDQKGYWATQVATNIAGNLPVIGGWLQKVVVGGPAYGHHTLTRFYALHVAVLPPIVIVLTALHIYVFRRHGVTHEKDPQGLGWFWPDQAFRDLLVCLLIFGIMLGLVVFGHGVKLDGGTHGEEQSFYQKWAHAGRDGLGANLDAPADPSRAYPARPEWYFLSLFQLLKYFEGDKEIIGTVIIPNGIFVVLAILPLLAFGQRDGPVRKLAQIIAVVFVTAVLVGVASLTCLALAEDTVEPVSRKLLQLLGLQAVPLTAAVFLVWLGIVALLGRGGFRSFVYGVGSIALLVMLGAQGYLLMAAQRGKDALPPQVVQFVEQQMTPQEKEPTDKAKKFHEELAAAEVQADRAIHLAQQGVPAEGATQLLRRDPLTQGPKLFEANCGSCHSHGKLFQRPKFTAADLEGFGSEEWIYRLLLNPGHADFFGRTGRTTMSDFIEESFPKVGQPDAELAKLPAEEKEEVAKNQKDLRTIARWLALHPRRTSPQADTPEFKAGLATFKARSCGGCHAYEGEGGTRKNRGPDLTGYGSEEWLRLMVTVPNHPRLYDLSNAMPLFRDVDNPSSLVAAEELNQIRDLLKLSGRKEDEVARATRVLPLSDLDRELIVRWLLKDFRVVFGGEPTAAAPR